MMQENRVSDGSAGMATVHSALQWSITLSVSFVSASNF